MPRIGQSSSWQGHGNRRNISAIFNRVAKTCQDVPQPGGPKRGWPHDTPGSTGTGFNRRPDQDAILAHLLPPQVSNMRFRRHFAQQ
jgi:hypothetical protein